MALDLDTVTTGPPAISRDQEVAEVLAIVTTAADTLVDVWPALGVDERIRAAAGELAAMAAVLDRGDRSAALLAAEACRTLCAAAAHHLPDHHPLRGCCR